MKKLFLLGLSVLWSAAPAAAAEDDAASVADAITGGKLLLNLRARYEHAEQDGKSEDANALTLRTLLGWETASYRGLSATAQLIDVGRLNSNYNDTRNGRTQFPVVADPDNTDINQLYLDYTGLPDTRLRAGKQIIKLDNVRFVGNVEFRQVMQVFTGVTLENRSLQETTLYVGHLERLKTVFGDQQAIRFDMAHGAWEWKPGNALIAYGYFLDSAKTVSATGFADNSNRVLGVRADGAYPLGEKFRALYTAEYAKQDRYADGDARIDAGYQHFGLGVGWTAWYLRIDHEVLGSNQGQYGFQTPLGTNHPFQGWADQFLTTPAQGMRDTYLSAGGPLLGARWSAEVHDFRSDFGGIHYGHEVDLGLGYALRKDLNGKIEIADFHEGDELTPAPARKRDTQRIWLTLVYDFK